MEPKHLLGLRSQIYPVQDLERAKAWWQQVLGIDPYFDQPFYVGFNVGGFELGLNPGGDIKGGPITYWGVEDIEAAVAHLTSKGATSKSDIADVGDGIRVAELQSLDGQTIGLIFNPHFKPGATG